VQAKKEDKVRRLINLPDTDIICARCGKPARIQAENGKVCITCWRELRAEKRELKTQDNLNRCFPYKTAKKLTDREEQIINEVMEDLKKKKTKGL